MKKWEQLFDVITGGVWAGIAVALMALVILSEIASRLILGKSTLVAQEFVAYLLIVFTFMSLGPVLKKNRHIKIPVVISHLPLRYQNLLEVFHSVLTLALIVYMVFWSLDLAIASYRNWETAESASSTPLFIPKAFIPIGLILFALQLVVNIINEIKKVILHY